MSAVTRHLELEELFAEINGEAVDDRVRTHLATCPRCRSEAELWEGVAGGVRHLVAATPSPEWPLEDVLAGAQETRALSPGNGRPRSLAGRKPRRKILVAVAAAVVLVASGASYELVAALGRSGPAPGPRNANGDATLTAVRGCPGLHATSGTLEQLNGTSLVLKTRTGQLVTVTTSASTKVSREVTGTLSDITDGAPVIVHGTGSDGRIAAHDVSIDVAPKLPTPQKPPHSADRRRIETGGQRANLGFAVGRVVHASAGSFTVVMPGGIRVRVTTSNSTTVYMLASATLTQFLPGQFIVAVGSPGPNGTLAATTVEEGAFLPRIELPPEGISGLPPIGCSSSAVATAALLSVG
jgi:hypothetical protein